MNSGRRTPITGGELARLHQHSSAEVDATIGRAQDAFLQWRSVPAPVRGQLAILVPQPEIQYAYTVDAGYMFPRPDGIVLGGTFERGVSDATPDPAAIAAIVQSHRRFMAGFRCAA